MADTLSNYRAKRDFNKTSEPSWETPVKPRDRRRFVIQKLDATRLHYDLRLELGGVFQSWAVTKGPSLDPHAKQLAVEVEDHPLDYGVFEGTIPRVQYGGGTVMLWDRGIDQGRALRMHQRISRHHPAGMDEHEPFDYDGKHRGSAPWPAARSDTIGSLR
jgi:DNA ligase D-like protein (predicted 3'-phosphoesterase)